MKKIIVLFLAFVAFGSAQETYRLAGKSSLTISGSSTVHDWTVSANAMNGTLSAAKNTPKEITFEVAVADIQSERGPTMDNKMHSALKRAEHPTITFTLNEVKGTSTLVGTLRIAGVEKKVDLETEITSLANGLALKGETKIILQDYGIEPPTAMFGQIIVGDEVSVTFDLVFASL